LLEHEFAAARDRRVGCGFITWSLSKEPRLPDLVPFRLHWTEDAIIGIDENSDAAFLDREKRR